MKGFRNPHGIPKCLSSARLKYFKCFLVRQKFFFCDVISNDPFKYLSKYAKLDNMYNNLKVGTTRSDCYLAFGM